MINKITEDEEFSNADSFLMKIFSVRCGISIDCARLQDTSLDLAAQLRCFFDISSPLAPRESIQDHFPASLGMRESSYGPNEPPFFGGRFGNSPDYLFD
jgi:hypothetical protein